MKSETEESNAAETAKECRIKISNFSRKVKAVQMKKFVQNRLEGFKLRKFKFIGDAVFVSLESEAATDKAIQLLSDSCYKSSHIHAVKAKPNDEVVLKLVVPKSNEIPSNSLHRVAPLVGVPYEKQLQIKFEHSAKIVKILANELRSAKSTYFINTCKTLEKVLPSPLVEGYRNKCEFSVGYSPDVNDGKLPVVGFVCGKMASKQCEVMPIDENFTHLSLNTRAIVRRFEAFIRKLEEKPFDEFNRLGFWKMLTVKDFLGDTMLIITVFPHSDKQVTEQIKKQLTDTFLPSNAFDNETSQFNVTSIYWQEQINAGDERIYEHVAGAPYVYESLLGINFRIAPSTFFQVNTPATEVLYTTIGNLLNIPSPYSPSSESQTNLKEPETKKIKLEVKESAAKTDEEKPIVVLDLCCGAGTISLCLMQRLKKAQRKGLISPTIPFGCVGIELNAEAVKDARKNATENGFDAKSCVYIDGEAERLFRELEHYLPSGCSLANSQVLGVLDPPRAGVSDKVVIGCRKLQQLRTLCFVSCDPKAATKNLLDLCRPASRKFEGDPFRIVKIQPVDLFPQTEHVEWVIKLER